MSDCMTCFGRGTVIGSDGKPKACPNCGSGFTADEQLLADLYRRYDRMVRRVAAVTLNWGDSALIDDIAQDTWLQVWTCVQRGADLTTRPAAGLIATITRRMVGMHYRRVTAAKRPRTRPMDPTDALIQRITATGSTEDVVMAQITARETIAALPAWATRTRTAVFEAVA